MFFLPRLPALLVAFYHPFSRRQVEEGGGEEPYGPVGARDNAVFYEDREHSLLGGLAPASPHRQLQNGGKCRSGCPRIWTTFCRVCVLNGCRLTEMTNFLWVSSA